MEESESSLSLFFFFSGKLVGIRMQLLRNLGQPLKLSAISCEANLGFLCSWCLGGVGLSSFMGVLELLDLGLIMKKVFYLFPDAVEAPTACVVSFSLFSLEFECA